MIGRCKLPTANHGVDPGSNGSSRPSPSDDFALTDETSEASRSIWSVRGLERVESISWGCRTAIFSGATNRKTPSGDSIRRVAAVKRLISFHGATNWAAGAKARGAAERPEAAVPPRSRNVEVGGSGGYGRMGTCGGRPPTAGERDCGAVAGRSRPTIPCTCAKVTPQSKKPAALAADGGDSVCR